MAPARPTARPPATGRTDRRPWPLRTAIVLGWLLVAFLHPCPAPARALDATAIDPSDYALCRQATALAERETGVPDQLLTAISRVETGREDPSTGRIEAWPWTADVNGTGHVYASRAEAIDAVRRYAAAGIRSIDVGCMQINLAQHPDAFASLDAAFDPATNAQYAAGFLTRLFQQTGSWPHAAAAYHSQTPELGRDYQVQVLERWAEGDPPSAAPGQRRRAAAAIRIARAAAPSPGPGAAPGSGPGSGPGSQAGAGSLFAASRAGLAPGVVGGSGGSPFGAGGAGTARIGGAGVHVVSYGPPAGGPVGNGRGLAAYRAMPIPLAARRPFPTRF